MKLTHRTWFVAVGAVLCFGIFGIVFPLLSVPSNCGGNSAALSKCRSLGLCYRILGHDRGTPVVSLFDLTVQERALFRTACKFNWLGDATLLVRRTVDLREPKQIVAVCDTPFDNVPHKRFGRAPFTHAVGYADGKAGLISPAEFWALDLREFRDLREFHEPDGSDE